MKATTPTKMIITVFFFRLFHSFFCCCFNLINFQINGAGRIYYYSVFFFSRVNIAPVAIVNIWKTEAFVTLILLLSLFVFCLCGARRSPW